VEEETPRDNRITRRSVELSFGVLSGFCLFTLTGLQNPDYFSTSRDSPAYPFVLESSMAGPILTGSNQRPRWSLISVTRILSSTWTLWRFLGDLLGTLRLASAALAHGGPAKVLRIFFLILFLPEPDYGPVSSRLVCYWFVWVF
jgi:hypothetical protein